MSSYLFSFLPVHQRSWERKTIIFTSFSSLWTSFCNNLDLVLPLSTSAVRSLFFLDRSIIFCATFSDPIFWPDRRNVFYHILFFKTNMYTPGWKPCFCLQLCWDVKFKTRTWNLLHSYLIVLAFVVIEVAL